MLGRRQQWAWRVGWPLSGAQCLCDPVLHNHLGQVGAVAQLPGRAVPPRQVECASLSVGPMGV